MYLFDADVLIQAKNTYYAFDICPGFWDFLERECNGGEIRSIRQVRLELEAGTDELARWARAKGSAFFLEPTAAAVAAMLQVVAWANAGPFTDTAKREFLAKADSFLVAQALGDDHTVVTNESPNGQGQISKIKIPTACAALGVPVERSVPVLRARGAEFVLP